MNLLDSVNVQNEDYGFETVAITGTCSDPAGYEVKTLTLTDSFETLRPGSLISIDFTYANAYGNGSTTYPKAYINSTYSAVPVCDSKGHYLASGAWDNGDTVVFFFTGTKLLAMNLTLSAVNTAMKVPVNSAAVNGALADYHNYKYDTSLTDANKAFSNGGNTYYSVSGASCSNLPNTTDIFLLESHSCPAIISSNYYGYQRATATGYNKTSPLIYERIKKGADSWTDWVQIVDNTSLTGALADYGKLTTIDDTHTIPSTIGKEIMYYLDNTASNLPTISDAVTTTRRCVLRVTKTSTNVVFSHLQIWYYGTSYVSKSKEFTLSAYYSGSAWVWGDWEEHVDETSLTSALANQVTNYNLANVPKRSLQLTYSGSSYAWLKLCDKPNADVSLFFRCYVGGNKDNNFGTIIDVSVNFYSTKVRVLISRNSDITGVVDCYTAIGDDGAVYIQFIANYGTSAVNIDDIFKNGSVSRVGYGAKGVASGFTSLEMVDNSNSMEVTISSEATTISETEE